MDKQLELKLKLLDIGSELTNEEKREEYHYQCLEGTDEYNHYAYPVPIIEFRSGNWSYKCTKKST